MTMIAFRKSYVFPKEYPSDFFEQTGHINPEYFNKIQNEPMRNLFQRALSREEERITAAEFLTLARSVLTDVVAHIPIIILGRRNNRGDGQTDNGQTDDGQTDNGQTDNGQTDDGHISDDSA